MKNAEQFLGRFFLDRRGAPPRILEVRDHLGGVYLALEGEDFLLVGADALSENIGDLFTTRERAERAKAQIMNALAARRVNAPADKEAPAPKSGDNGKRPPARRDDPAFVELVSAVLDLPVERTRVLEAIIGHPYYRPHKFTQGMLAGHEVAAINLIDAQAGVGLDYPELVDVIVDLKKQSLIEVVSDALAPGQPELARFWLIVNPDCVAAIASASSPVGLVA